MNEHLCWLGLTTLFFLLAWLPISIGKYQAKGVKYLAGNRDESLSNLPLWAQRAERAYCNWKDYFVGFPVAVFAVVLLQKTNEQTLLACQLYFFGRLAHYLFYTLGLPKGRMLGYFLSFGANLFLLFKVLS